MTNTSNIDTGMVPLGIMLRRFIPIKTKVIKTKKYGFVVIFDNKKK